MYVLACVHLRTCEPGCLLQSARSIFLDVHKFLFAYVTRLGIQSVQFSSSHNIHNSVTLQQNIGPLPASSKDLVIRLL